MGARRTLVVFNHLKVYQNLILELGTTREEKAYYVRQMKDMLDLLLMEEDTDDEFELLPEQPVLARG